MKNIIFIICIFLSLNLFAEERYQMVAGKDAHMWILDTKTSEVFHCFGGNPCVFLSNLEKTKKIYPYNKSSAVEDSVDEMKTVSNLYDDSKKVR